MAAPADGCCILPGDEAPEVVIFEDLAKIEWGDIWIRLLRDASVVSDACSSSMILSDHHDWVPEAATRLMVGDNILWHAMCAEWVKRCMEEDDYVRVKNYVEDRLADYA